MCSWLNILCLIGLRRMCIHSDMVYLTLNLDVDDHDSQSAFLCLKMT